jgi:acetamidase/formamidase
MHDHSIHGVRPDAYHHVWDREHRARSRAGAGAEVGFQVRDASDEQFNSESTSADVAALDFGRVNPVCGPVFVKGARPGDALEVEILEFDPRDWGWTAIIPGFGLWPMSSTSVAADLPGRLGAAAVVFSERWCCRSSRFPAPSRRPS